MNDFPIREYRTVLHVRRRRWKDAEGKSVSKDWQMVAKGTRYSKEFATFSKEYRCTPCRRTNQRNIRGMIVIVATSRKYEAHADGG